MGTTLRWGLYVAVAGFVLSLITYFTGIDKTSGAQWFGSLTYVFLLLAIIWCLKERRVEDYGGSLTYGQGLGSGLMVAVWAGLFSVILTYIYLNFVNPELIDYIQQAQQKAMEARGMSPDQMRTQAGFMKLFMSPLWMSVMVLFMMVFVGLIESLIVAAVMKRTPKEEAVVIA